MKEQIKIDFEKTLEMADFSKKDIETKKYFLDNSYLRYFIFFQI